MSNPRYHPRGVRLWKLGSKCVDDQFLLAPTEEVYTLVMLFLAKMQELYDVELIAFVFMGPLDVPVARNNLQKQGPFFPPQIGL